MRFADIPGHEKAKQHVRASWAAGRFAHAHLIAGPSGVGQLAFAVALAQYINCQSPVPEGDSCEACTPCRQMARLQHPDVTWVLPIVARTAAGKAATTDEFLPNFRKLYLKSPFLGPTDWAEALGAENKQLIIPIAEMRELQKRTSMRPFGGGQKVVIIWEAEKMNMEAANAFLKLLEEPPGQTLLLLVAESPAKLLPTIVSRTQRISLGPVPPAALALLLQSKFGVSEQLAQDASAMAEGSISQALRIANSADAPISNLYMDWMRLCYKTSIKDLSEWAADLARAPREQQKHFFLFALQKLRDSALVQAQAQQLAFIPTAEAAFIQNLNTILTAQKINLLHDLFSEALANIGRNANATMLFTVVGLKVGQVLRMA